tara:strand:- start:9506 stop:11062 length:1557 start_codon:yes stop_codon:yes gene_type:complete
MQKPATLLVLAMALAFTASTHAELRLPSIFGENMVLQRDIPLKIWGWDNPGQSVTVTIGEQTAQGKAGEDGRWEVKLSPLQVTQKALEMNVQGSSAKTLGNILVGEVWVCSGQSNMQWAVSSSDDADLETLTAKFPNIRLISIPLVGTQEPQYDFQGQWLACSPETVRDFSAVGYFFGRTLHQALDVPIGLIDNAWGGSAAEAWVRREVLEADDAYSDYLAIWESKEANVDANMARWEKAMAAWKTKAAEAKAAGKNPPRAPRSPEQELKGQHRPGNLHNGVLLPIIGYGIRGAIWYQGENNSGRAYNYRSLFPLMISQWRELWNQGDFPFYWVQLADFMNEQPAPTASAWAELREAQTMTLSLPNTGQAVICDLGEAHDIHPKDKQNVAKRLARHALAKDYGIEIVAESPRYASHKVQGNKVIVEIDHFGAGLDTFDVRTPHGFAIAGEDQQFVWADAKIVGNNIEVSSPEITAPVAVRYAWADNPVANVQNRAGLPLTPFRTDDWEMVTNPKNSSD